MKLKIVQTTCLLSIMGGLTLGLVSGVSIYKSIYGIEIGQKIDVLELVILLIIMIVPAIVGLILGCYIWLKVACIFIPKNIVAATYNKILFTNQNKSSSKFLDWVIGENNRL